MTGAKASAIFLCVFLAVVLGVGFTIGLTIRPGEWYQSLERPFFTPPDWVFGPAWTLIYVLIAVAGWRVGLTEGFRTTAFRLWGLQMILNWAWTPVFFGAHLIGIGLAVILALLTAAVAFMTKVVDRTAFWCFAPYVLWLTYAAALNGAIFVLN
jgi:benzodiazapine receptor